VKERLQRRADAPCSRRDYPKPYCTPTLNRVSAGRIADDMGHMTSRLIYRGLSEVDVRHTRDQRPRSRAACHRRIDRRL
jgi:hypothetical protein